MVVSIGVTVNGATLTCNSLDNSGVIYDTEITCSGNITNSGEIHVPVTIDGVAYSSTPGSPVKFLYGATALSTLNEWYKEKYNTGSEVLCRWCDANGSLLNGDLTLGLSGNGFSLFKITLDKEDPKVGDTVNATGSSLTGTEKWTWYYVKADETREQMGESDNTGKSSCYYIFAPCSWQPATGEGHLVA